MTATDEYWPLSGWEFNPRKTSHAFLWSNIPTTMGIHTVYPLLPVYTQNDRCIVRMAMMICDTGHVTKGPIQHADPFAVFVPLLQLFPLLLTAEYFRYRFLFRYYKHFRYYYNYVIVFRYRYSINSNTKWMTYLAGRHRRKNSDIV